MEKLLRLNSLLAIVLCLILISPTLGDEKTDAVDNLFSKWDKPDSPGCALAVIQDGEIIYKQGYGVANLELGVPITPKTVFYMGSVSKQFVAFCIALLSKQGKLSLDDSIREYVPEIQDYGTPITIRHLIHHMSGLRDYLALEDIAGIPIGHYHKQDVIQLIARQKELNFKPGEEYLYSNSGYFLLAVVVERVSGKPFRTFAEENIFKPLGMKNSRFHDDYTRLIKNRASGYFPAAREQFKNFITTFDCVGSGGLYTSVEDLYLWDQNFYHAKVGGRDLIDLLHTRGKLKNGERLQYAFALRIGKHKGLKTVSHGGGLGGYRSAYLRFPEQKFSVICLSNLSSFQPIPLARKVADIYLAGQIKEEKLEAKRDGQKEAKNIRFPEGKLKEKVGYYIGKKTGSLVRVFFQDGRLFMVAFNRKLSLTALSETEFVVLEAPVKTFVKFKKPKIDSPKLMHIQAQGETPRVYEAFERVGLSPEELQEYAGDFYSDELQVIFRVKLKESKLYFTHRNAPKPPLFPIIKDRFSVRGFKIIFERDKEGRISAFTLSARRVRNLRFEKK